MIKIREMEDGIIIPAKIQPNSNRDKIIGEYAEKLKIKVKVMMPVSLKGHPSERL
jgi:uncharacterized protein YggU (UPF0235/DUF167 family)